MSIPTKWEKRQERPEIGFVPPKFKRLCDGYEIFKWPEFIALVDRLGLPINRNSYTFQFYIGKPVVPERPTLDGYEFYAWKEFQNLAYRLGMPLNLYTVGGEITIAKGEMPKIKLDFACVDRTQPKE